MSITPLPIDLLELADKLVLKRHGELLSVFDPCRRKYVTLEPEEFVRQLFIIYLHDVLDIGYGRMVTEKKLNNYQQNRFDLAVMDSAGKWSLLVECKSFRAPLDEKSVIQLSKYNTEMQAVVGILTNGKQTYAWRTGPTPEFILQESDLIGLI